MSLDVNIDNIKNNCQLRDEYQPEKLDAVTTVLAVYLNSIGIPHITPNNSEEVFLRAEMLSLVQGGGPFVKDGDHYRLTLDHIERRINMEINGRTLTATQFARELHCTLKDKAKHEFARQRQQQALCARGYLFCQPLLKAVNAVLERARRVTLSTGWVTLATVEDTISKWGPVEWREAFGQTSGTPSMGEIAKANVEKANIVAAWDLSTPIARLVDIDKQLKKHASE